MSDLKFKIEKHKSELNKLLLEAKKQGVHVVIETQGTCDGKDGSKEAVYYTKLEINLYSPI